MSDVKEFINPKATLTPGIAGSLVLLLTNAIHLQFETPIKQGWTALARSLLLALLVVADLSEAYWKKGVYLMINTLVVFAFAMGANSTIATPGKANTKSEDKPRGRTESSSMPTSPGVPSDPAASLKRTFTTAVAEAQQSSVATSADETKRLEDLKRKEQVLQSELERKQEELRKTQEALEQLRPIQKSLRRFFQPWSF